MLLCYKCNFIQLAIILSHNSQSLSLTQFHKTCHCANGISQNLLSCFHTTCNCVQKAIALTHYFTQDVVAQFCITLCCTSKTLSLCCHADGLAKLIILTNISHNLSLCCHSIYHCNFTQLPMVLPHNMPSYYCNLTHCHHVVAQLANTITVIKHPIVFTHPNCDRGCCVLSET